MSYLSVVFKAFILSSIVILAACGGGSSGSSTTPPDNADQPANGGDDSEGENGADDNNGAGGDTGSGGDSDTDDDTNNDTGAGGGTETGGDEDTDGDTNTDDGTDSGEDSDTGGDSDEGSDTEEETDNGTGTDTDEPQRLGIILIGDSGSGSDGAYAVGQAVARVCAVKQCDLVLGLGDNIYESGVSSAFDPQFEEKFEQPFAPVDLPFYMVLGNHDNSEFFGGDGAGNSNGDFQVDYHYRRASQPEEMRQTERWQMPARYYRFSKGEIDSQPFVEFFGIDSNQVAGGFPDSDENYSYNNYGLAQAQWLNEAMAASNAKWKIAFAHHPYISNGSHGNAGNYDGVPAFIAPVLAGERYQAFLQETICDKADFLFAGHDHDLQWLMPVDSCGKTEFIVSGAASKTRSIERRDENPVFYEKGDSYGFVWVEITGDEMRGEVYEVDPTSANLGLGSLDDPQPSYSRVMSQRDSVGLPDNDGFTSPLQPEPGFDVDGESGNLDPVQQQFVAAFTGLANGIPEENLAALLNALSTSAVGLLEVADALVTGVSGAASEQNPELALAGAARASQALLYSLQSLRDGVPANGEPALPAPFDQLGSVLDLFEQDAEAAKGDLRLISDALNGLVLNLHNIVDAAEEEGGSVPVLGGTLGLLSELIFDVSRLLTAVGNVDSSEVGQVVVSTTDDLLSNLLLNVVPIEQAAPAELVDAIGLGPQLLSSALLAVVREVTYTLDNTLLVLLSPLLGNVELLLLEPLLGGLGGLSGS